MLQISEGGWLHDTDITAAQCLLFKQFPHISGLMITTLYDIRDPDRGGLNQAKLIALRQGEGFGGVPTQSRRQLQILFVRGNHWITVTNVHQGPENLVCVGLSPAAF